MASGRISRIRPSATRIFQPPDSAPTSPPIISWLNLTPARTSRARPSRQDAPGVVGGVRRRVGLDEEDVVTEMFSDVVETNHDAWAPGKISGALKACGAPAEGRFAAIALVFAAAVSAV